MNPTAQVTLDEFRRLQGITGEPSMAGGDCSCGYGVLGRHLRNGEHQEAEKLTVMRLEVVAASGRALKWVIDGGRDLEREKGAWVRGNSGKIRQKPRDVGTYGCVGSWRSSRSRRRRGLGIGAADCRAAVASFERRSEKGEKEALGWGLYRPGVLR